MTAFKLEDGLAIWGAVPSTGLAAIKIRETWAARPRLEVSGLLSNDAGGDHHLHLTNLSATPVLLSTWAIVPTRRWLFWRSAKGRWLYMSGRTGAAEMLPPHGQLLITVGSHWSLQWQTAEALKRPPYLQLYVVGRKRPWLVRIVSPAQRRAAINRAKRGDKS